LTPIVQPSKILADSEQWLKKDASGEAGQLIKERKEMFLKINDALCEWVAGT
jgi:hypothetical protein